jgi:hypothetical protein
MIPADKLTGIASSIVEKWLATEKGHSAYALRGSERVTTVTFTTDELISFVEIILACGAAHEEHQRKHGR